MKKRLINIVNTAPLSALFVLLNLVPLQAKSAETLCAVLPTSIIKNDTFSPDGKTHLQSDKIEVNDKNISRFQGNVVIQQKDKRFDTQLAEYTKSTEQVEARGEVTFTSPSIHIKSETASFNLKTDQAVLRKSQYQSLQGRARGSASKIEIVTPKITQLTDATYTTCDPNNADWLLSASNISLNNETHQGTASNVVIRFKGVPFFYFPYFRFPLGESRLSGFLFPSFGHSNDHGDEFKIPYYWNIHPQADATFTPWYMSKRGTMLHTEFRYLTENSDGIFINEYLDDDKIFNDSRERWQWKHQTKPVLGWQAKAEYNSVTDNDHFIDFSNDLYNTSTSYLIRTGEVSYNNPNWLVNIKAEGHQILSGAEQYKRLPQVTLNSRHSIKDNNFNYRLQSEAVKFDHVDNIVIGERLHIKPSISYPLRSSAGFLDSKLTLQHTNYNLQQTNGETQLSRTIPSFSLNSGLFFERESELFGHHYIQTLEPQLFYVYVPYEDQSDLPIFDTSAYNFNVNQSFADYRFNGIDRIGDDNRITTALATRFISQKNGAEIFMARVGQIHYFSDREVQLPATSIETRSESNLIAELKTQFSRWNISSQLEWDPTLKENVSSSSQLGYKMKAFNMQYAQRFQRNALETREIKMNWQLNSRWQFNASHLYDIRDDHVVENLFGINYESCCWALRLNAKERYLSSTETDRGVYLELVLKGLGGFGIQQ